MARNGLAGSPLTVGDLFCGAGGFAEGFRQAGCQITWGVDIWKPAVDTFQRNFPGAEAIWEDVLQLDPRQLEPVDVLIGSPPCVHFSPANRGGNGDREEGMKLVRRFLEVVLALRPRYWVMENVPALRYDLQERMEGTSFIDGSFRITIPSMKVLDSSNYETPQTRLRLFSGDFPSPEPLPASTLRLTLRDVVRSLPDPRASLRRPSAAVSDPVYSGLRVRNGDLRDHFEDLRWRLTKEEIDTTVEHRARDRIYGVMPFPDALDAPARTITATKTRGSRATVVIPWPAGSEVPYRTLTLRECASAQGFPLTFQFWADSMSGKDFLIGNAVPPPLARNLASAILRSDGKSPPNLPLVERTAVLPPIVRWRPKGPRRFSMKRRFRGSVSVDWRRNHRVELDNELPTTRSFLPADTMPEVTWRTRLYLGYATEYRCYEVGTGDALSLVSALSGGSGALIAAPLARLMLAVTLKATNGFPDGIRLQEVWSGWRPPQMGPRWLLALVARQIDHAFPARDFEGQTAAPDLTAAVLGPCLKYRGTDADETPPIDASIRLLASTIALSLYCEKLNVGTLRLEKLREGILAGRGIRGRALASLFSPGRRLATEKARRKMLAFA